MNIVDNLLLVSIIFINLVKFKMIQLDTVLYYNCILFVQAEGVFSFRFVYYFFHLDYITTTTVNYEGLGIAELQPAARHCCRT